jgi:hypothetical protein
MPLSSSLSVLTAILHSGLCGKCLHQPPENTLIGWLGQLLQSPVQVNVLPLHLALLPPPYPPPQTLRAQGVRVLTVREILAFGVEERMGARVELEDLAASTLTYRLSEGEPLCAEAVAVGTVAVGAVPVGAVAVGAVARGRSWPHGCQQTVTRTAGPRNLR